MSNNLLFFVPAKDIPTVWNKVKPLIDKALAHNLGEQTSQDVLAALLKRQSHLLVGVVDGKIEMALIGEVQEFPQKTIFLILTWATKSGHDYEKWMPLFYVVEDFARSQGCTLISAWTRKGLAKKLNWKHEHSVVTKEL